MQLDHPFIRLPLRFDAARIADEIEQLGPDAWRPHPQGFAGNDVLPLVAAHGDPANDAAHGPMRPTSWLERCPALRQVFATLDTVVGRSRLMRLAGRGEATPHIDTNYYWIDRARVHVPIVTTPGVAFACGGEAVHMAAGECWIFDTWRAHNVLNPDDSSRIHLVIDTVGSAPFWSLVARGRPGGHGAPGDVPDRIVAVDVADRTPLRFESFNAPVVMSPWELTGHCARLSAELDPATGAAAVAAFQRCARALRQDWRALWAQFGEGRDGHAAYAELLRAFDRDLAAIGSEATLRNGAQLVDAARQFVVRAALNPELARGVATATSASVPAVVAPRAAAASVEPAADPLPAPVFIVCPPRSGASLLFETLAQSPDFVAIGGESHAVIEGIAALSPASRGLDSNRLFAADATPETVAVLHAGLAARLRDRLGEGPRANEARRLLEKTPKNALRVPFLAAAFPDARFIYLYRDARESVSRMLDGWRSGRFVTHAQLPGWNGPPWSFLLTPGWREWQAMPLAEVVARQWATSVRVLLDDLDALDPERWCVASYDRLVSEPQAEVQRLCEFLGVRCDRTLAAPRHAPASPSPGIWQRNAAELEPVMALVAAQANRAHAVFARPPATRRPRDVPAHSPAKAAVVAKPLSFASVHTPAMRAVLERAGASLAITTYQTGRLILARADSDALNTHLRAFPSPMGLARRGDRLAMGTQRSVWMFNNQAELAARVDAAQAHDACFVPSREHITGDIRVHELAFAGDELWLVNTRFSCLATLDDRHSFVPRWRPRFISALAAEDRCHLNGLAVHEGRCAYVTALGTSDKAAGWREDRASGGCIIDVASGELVATGLSMPHSPRVHDGRLWVLESGKGTLACVDPADGRSETVATLPGFARGLAFAGGFAFVGLSQVRETIFEGVPVTERTTERECGVWLVELATGRIAGFLRFEGDVREIFDVQLLEGLRFPDLLEPDHERVGSSFVLSDAALADVATPAPAPRVRRMKFEA